MRRIIVGMVVLAGLGFALYGQRVWARGGARGGGAAGRGGAGAGISRGGAGASRAGAGGSAASRAPSFSAPRQQPARPAASARPDSRPGIVEAPRRPSSLDRSAGPAVGTRPSMGTRPGMGDRPSLGTRPGVGDRPGMGAGVGAGPARPATLPGLGNRPAAGLPGFDQGRAGRADTRQARAEQRPQSRDERRQDLQSRLTSREDSRHGQLDDRQDFRAEGREDWQEWHGEHYPHHDHWHHGYWHGNAGDWWHHMWDEHTAFMAFRTTMWGMNRLAYSFGYWGYANPYATEPVVVSEQVVIDYSQPVMSDYPSAEAQPAPPASNAAADTAFAVFDSARSAFAEQDYPKAQSLVERALATLPQDATLHEFRALTLFAQGKYREAAAAMHSVLAVGPGWDWTTMSSLYTDTETYTKQLRALERHVDEHPDASDGRFLLAYHYITCGYASNAADQLKQVVRAVPSDRVSVELLESLIGPAAAAEAVGRKPAPPKAATPSAQPPKIDNLYGSWNAKARNDSQFSLQLSKDGAFSWTYMQGKTKQSLDGVFALDGTTLAMEPSSGGVMLAEISTPKADQLQFRVLGAPADEPPLVFQR